jgi:uncharacterized protein YjiS (DUF1127 family)
VAIFQFFNRGMVRTAWTTLHRNRRLCVMARWIHWLPRKVEKIIDISPLLWIIQENNSFCGNSWSIVGQSPQDYNFAHHKTGGHKNGAASLSQEQNLPGPILAGHWDQQRRGRCYLEGEDGSIYRTPLYIMQVVIGLQYPTAQQKKVRNAK